MPRHLASPQKEESKSSFDLSLFGQGQPIVVKEYQQRTSPVKNFKGFLFSRRGGLCCCLFLLLLIAIGMLLGYFFYPRAPSIDFEGLEAAGQQASNTTNVVKASSADTSAKGTPSIANGKLASRMIVKMRISSTNYVSVYVNNVTFEASSTPAHGYKAQIGGGYMDSLVEVQKRDYADVRIPFNFSIPITNLTANGNVNSDSKIAKNISSWHDILDSCGMLGNPPKKFKLQYTAKLSLNAISTVMDLYPSVDDSIDIDCPFQTDLLGQLPEVQQYAAAWKSGSLSSPAPSVNMTTNVTAVNVTSVNATTDKNATTTQASASPQSFLQSILPSFLGKLFG